MTIASVNPATNETLQVFEAMTADDVKAIIGVAHTAFKQWRYTEFEQRKACLQKFADLLRSNSREYARTITLEMGKRISESEYEIEYCAKIAEFYANGAEHFLIDQPMNVDGIDAYLSYQPLGVLLGVMPWNFPFYQVVRFAAPNIMAGNTIMVKHASNVPMCAVAIERLFQECGLPRGVYANLLIRSELVGTIVSDSRVQGVSLTGSEPAGAAVAAVAGRSLKRSVLELGGNDPFLVLEDADLDHAIEQGVKGRIVNAGQSCIASKRFIVVEAVAELFIEGFRTQMELLQLGDPMDDQTTLAPLSSEDAAVTVQQQVKSALNAGATAILGGDRPEREGAYFNPTILANVKKDNPIFDQEIFGPVATIYVVKDERAAIELANDSSYGLGGSVFTADLERGRRIAEQVETGMMFINQRTQSRTELPFGGIKNSGYGRELSHLGILEFVNKKLIHAGGK